MLTYLMDFNNGKVCSLIFTSITLYNDPAPMINSDDPMVGLIISCICASSIQKKIKFSNLQYLNIS